MTLNEQAWTCADVLAANAAAWRVHVDTVGGERIIDCGGAVSGGLQAGLQMARVCLAGQADVALEPGPDGPMIQVFSDDPVRACLASQYAGWAVNPSGFFAMGSGPLRAKARVERELFARLGYKEDAPRGVLVLEGRSLPTDEVAIWLAGKAGLAPEALTLAVAPTASFAGGVQIVARVLETGLHKMDAIGFDVKRVVSAMGTAPLPPTARSDIRAIGRTNDSILYGGRARYAVQAGDDELAELAERLPASASADYGTPFHETFKRYGNDFYKIDPLLFSPGEVWLTSLTSGRTFHGGRLNPDLLQASLGGS